MDTKNAREVLAELEKIGIKVSQRFLQRYAKRGLITKPNTKSLGRGLGKESLFSPVVIQEIMEMKQCPCCKKRGRNCKECYEQEAEGKEATS